MTRSDVRSRGGAALLALMFGCVTVLSAGSAFAKKKKKGGDEAAAQESGEASPAAQAGDTEKPKTILDQGQEAPKTDSLGHVHFGSPGGEGLGRIAVKADPEAKIKVFLEGRYFGTAPVTVYSVPKGDYIVEAVYPNGKQVSKPVSVGENQETDVDLGGAKALVTGGGGPGFFSAEMTPTRLTMTKVFLVTAALGVVGAVTFGILELRTESEYNDAVARNAGNAERDEIEERGRRWALYTNIGIGVAAVGAIGAAVAGYPLVFKPSEKKMATLTIMPSASPQLTGGVLTLRF
jgi:hypothetical protein